MNKLLNFMLLVSLILNSCNMEPNKESIDLRKNEILKTEQSFAKMAREEGIHKAFMTYAAEDAVLMRNNDLIIGQKDIDRYLENQTSKDLSWIPDFVDVAQSGDLGYTYGSYTFSYIDKNGKSIDTKGIFHTVWKRQSDGKWLFVWD